MKFLCSVLWVAGTLEIFCLVLYMKGKNKCFGEGVGEWWGPRWTSTARLVVVPSSPSWEHGTTHLAPQEYISLTFKISYLLLCRNVEPKPFCWAKPKWVCLEFSSLKKFTRIDWGSLTLDGVPGSKFLRTNLDYLQAKNWILELDPTLHLGSRTNHELSFEILF